MILGVSFESCLGFSRGVSEEANVAKDFCCSCVLSAPPAPSHALPRNFSAELPKSGQLGSNSVGPTWRLGQNLGASDRQAEFGRFWAHFGRFCGTCWSSSADSSTHPCPSPGHACRRPYHRLVRALGCSPHVELCRSLLPWPTSAPNERTCYHYYYSSFFRVLEESVHTGNASASRFANISAHSYMVCKLTPFVIIQMRQISP